MEGAGLEFPAPLAPLAPFGTATDPHRAPLLVAHHPFNVDAPRHVDLNILVVIIPLTGGSFFGLVQFNCAVIMLIFTRHDCRHRRLSGKWARKPLVR